MRVIEQPPENPELIMAMKNVAGQDNKLTRLMLYRALLKSVLLLPTQSDGGSITDEHGNAVMKPAQELGIIMARSPEGDGYLLAFTDLAALQAWRSDNTYYMGLPGQQVFAFAQQNGLDVVLLNPAGPVSGQVNPSEIEALARGAIPGQHEDVTTKTVDGQVEVEVLPATGEYQPSDTLIQEIQDHLQHQPTVKAAYAFVLQLPDQDPSLMVGIQFSDPKPQQHQLDAAFRQMVNAVYPHSEFEKTLTFMELQGEMLDYVQANLEPIFQTNIPQG